MPPIRFGIIGAGHTGGLSSERGLRLLAILLLIAASPALALPPAPRPFDADRAYRDLAKQCEFGPRVPGTQAHTDCLRWLAATLYLTADTVTVQQFKPDLDGKPVQFTNVIATFNPKGSPQVLLCAHWDSRPTADRDPDPANRAKPIPGANDGASGVAVLLEIARALKAHPPRQRVTIALFDGEDYGATREQMFLGSRAFARDFFGTPVDWGVLLDMVGDRDLRLPPERFSLEKAPTLVDRVWSAAERVGSNAFVRGAGPAVLDDHVYLIQHGIPCIDVIDFDYPYWHTVADTPDKCSAESLDQVGRAILAALDD